VVVVPIEAAPKIEKNDDDNEHTFIVIISLVEVAPKIRK
jgi:hypothetical protein